MPENSDRPAGVCFPECLPFRLKTLEAAGMPFTFSLWFIRRKLWKGWKIPSWFLPVVFESKARVVLF